MTILGFDQSTTTSGFCTFIDNKYDSSGVINLKSIKDADERLMLMAKRICQCIDRVKPDQVVIEDIFDKKNIHTLVVLGRLQGAIMLHCYENNIPISILQPSTWRKIVHIKQGKRAEMKAAAVEFVEEKYGLNITADEAEAVCITQAAL